MKTLDILGYTYQVVADEGMAELRGNMGDSSVLLQVLRIGSEIHPEAQVSTLFHEILHAINVHLGIGLAEEQITMLEAGLWAVFRANGFDLSPLEEALDG